MGAWAPHDSIGGRLPPRSMSVFGQPSSIWRELTGIAMVLKDCPDEEDLNNLTDSLSTIVLLLSNAPQRSAAVALSAYGASVAAAFSSAGQ